MTNETENINCINENQIFRCWLGDKIVREHKGVIVDHLFEAFREANPDLLDTKIKDEWRNQEGKTNQNDNDESPKSCIYFLRLLYKQKALQNELKKYLEVWMNREEREEIENFLSQIGSSNHFIPIKLSDVILTKYIFEDDTGADLKESSLYLDDELKHIKGIVDSYSIYKKESDENPEKFLSKVKIELYKIWAEITSAYWSTFNIKEKYSDVFLFWKENIENKNSDCIEQSNLERWENWEKLYFYSKNKKDEFDGYLGTATESFLIEHPEPDDDKFIEGNESYGYVYLVRNEDIYKIGITKDLDRRLGQLKPDELINSIECINYKEIEKELHDTFKDFRIPQTEYFRLDETQVEMAIELMFELEKF